jgi:hypothetical protein
VSSTIQADSSIILGSNVSGHPNEGGGSAKLFLDGGSDTYLTTDGENNTIKFFANNNEHMKLNNGYGLRVTGGVSASGGFYGQVQTSAQTAITSIFAEDLKIGEDDQTKIDFETENEIHFYANNEQILNIKQTTDSGSIAVSGSVKIQPQVLEPSISESRLYNRTSENGNYVDDLHFGTDGLTPAFSWVTLDDDGVDTNAETGFGSGSAITSTSHNMIVSHSSAGDGTHIYAQLDGIYKVTGNYTSIANTADVSYDTKVDGTTVHTMIARTHASVDPVERTHIYVGAVSSGSYISATADGTSFNYEAGSVLLVERLK